MKFAARFIISFLLLTICYLPFTNTAFAQSQEPKQDLHNYTQTVMLEVTSSLACLLAGVDPINPKGQCLGIDSQTHKIGYVQSEGGAIGAMGGLIAMTFTPPIHTGDYVKYLSSNFGLAKSAYADNGIGFNRLSPLLGPWTVFRNIAYLLFVIIFIVIGFAIMLRIHIDPRTVMTIENQIPKIIIGLIIVTFSFAISGFLIDLMYVGISLSTNILMTADSKLTAEVANRIAYSTNPLDAANLIGGSGGKSGGLATFAWEPSQAVGAFIAPIFDNEPGKFITGLGGAIIGKIVAGPIGDGISSVLTIGGAAIGGILGFFGGVGIGAIPGAAAGATAGHAIGEALKIILPIGGAVVGVAEGNNIVALFGSLIAFLIITIAILSALVRLWFELLKAYVFILIDIVFAPFWIIMGLVPGSPLSFTAWLREIGSQLIAFPATIVMLLLGKVFIDTFSQASGELFVPPLIGNPANNTIGTFIGLGIILMTPNVVNMMKAAFKAPKVDVATIIQSLAQGTGYAVNTPRKIAGIRSSAEELVPHKYVVNPITGGKELSYERRGLGDAIRGVFKGKS